MKKAHFWPVAADPEGDGRVRPGIVSKYALLRGLSDQQAQFDLRLGGSGSGGTAILLPLPAINDAHVIKAARNGQK